MNLEKRKKIHHFSLFYYFLKFVVGRWFKWYYRRFEADGLNNIPKGDPVIMAANHQNALMDALAILFSLPGSIVFLARADIFKNRTQEKILHRLKIMPVFRIRDGAENLSKNDETFDAALQVLRDNHPLCLMPEGNHGDKRRLRPLVKGIFRIAFQTQEELGESRKVRIVPVGVDYEHYQHIRKNLFVNFGPAIEVSDYMELYRENKARGMNALRDKLAEELKKQMIHIGSEQYYDVYQELRQYKTDWSTREAGSASCRLKARFERDKAFIDQLKIYEEREPAGMEKLAASVRELAAILPEKKLRYWLLLRKPSGPLALLWRILLLMIAAPLFAVGFLLNFLPFWYAGKIVEGRKLKDIQFFSSFAFVLGFVLFNIFYLLLAIPVFIFSPVWYVGLIIMLSLPFLALIAYQYYVFARKTMGVFRFMKLKRTGDPGLIRALELWKNVRDTMYGIMLEKK
ncbi:MAG: 1-acyl-sn-glycerol-3-phosphate acyltransferase [Bacteroidales bacterium]